MAREREREDSERRTRDAEERLAREAPARLGIPERVIPYLEVGTGRPVPLHQTEALRAVRDVRPGFVILCGPTGTGKSLAAGVWTWEYRPNSLFCHVGSIVRLDLYSAEGREEYERVLHCAALVIDDLGTERKDASDIWASRLDEVISTRYDRGEAAATIITTNKREDDLAEHVGNRVWSRLRDAGRFVNCVGPNMRTNQG